MLVVAPRLSSRGHSMPSPLSLYLNYLWPKSVASTVATASTASTASTVATVPAASTATQDRTGLANLTTSLINAGAASVAGISSVPEVPGILRVSGVLGSSEGAGVQAAVRVNYRQCLGSWGELRSEGQQRRWSKQWRGVLALAWGLSLGLGFAATSASADAIYDYNNVMVPDIGTAGILGMSVQREQAMGEFFMRQARSQVTVLDDPVLNEYVNSLGNRLQSNANNVLFPFEFFVVKNSSLNASAFLGGKVAIHTGLFTYAETEDEFASVLAHEISHITQRHLARYIESMTRATNLSIAGVVGSIALSLLNPALGMAAMSSNIGAMMQTSINYTRDNEYEADRLGIDLLYRAGFNPYGMVDMFRLLANQQGNINPAFVMLIDHPLSEIRVAEASNRALHYERRSNSTNPDYALARARVLVRYGSAHTPNEFEDLKQRLLQPDESKNAVYQNYALALTAYELKDYAGARAYLNKLPSTLHNNLFVLDLLTDIDIAAKQTASAITRLEQQYKVMPHNQVVVANLASAYIENQQYKPAERLLNRFIREHPQDILAYKLADQAYTKLNDRCNAYQMKGEVAALSAAYMQSIAFYNQALQECHDRLTTERLKARVVQIANQRSFDEALMRQQ